MRRDELRAAIERDPDAIVELVMTLTASVAALRAELDELKRHAGRDSRNSSLPPSRDSSAARAKRPKKGSGRKQGGSSGTPAAIGNWSPTLTVSLSPGPTRAVAAARRSLRRTAQRRAMGSAIR